MGKGYSITFAGLVVLLLGWYDQHFALEIGSGAIQTTVDTIVTLASTITPAGLLGVWYGRFRKGDVTWYGSRKK